MVSGKSPASSPLRPFLSFLTLTLTSFNGSLAVFVFHDETFFRFS